MPTFAKVYENFTKGKEAGLIGPDESIASYAQKALRLTGDPSYKSIAEGGTFGNAIRSGSAMLTNAINSTPVDEWLGEATKRVGDLFGVNPEASRSVGESLPRMAVDFAPMILGGVLAPVTGGASLAPGMALTSGLSAGNAYEQTGKLSDAAIGGAMPYVGSALSQVGSKAALNFAARSPALQRLGFTGGTKVTGAALNAADEATLAARGLAGETIAGTTKSFTQLDKPLDKFLGFIGGQTAAISGFTALDAVRHGTEAVTNREYLFSTLISSLPFAAADLASAVRSKPITEMNYNIPEAQPKFQSPGEEQAVRAAAMFEEFKNDPVKQEQLRKQYGLDVADVSLKSRELRDAVNARLLTTKALEDNFGAEWNNYVNTDPLARDAGFKPIQKGGPFGTQWIGLDAPLSLENLPNKAQEIVDRYKDGRADANRTYAGAVRKLATQPAIRDSLPHALEQLKLKEFLETPIEQRDYAKALENSFLSLDGVDLVKDIHRREAGLDPLRPELYQQFIDLYSGKPATFSPDKRIELITAASLARGSVPKFERAKKKAEEGVEEGKPTSQVVEEALKEMEKENVSVVLPELESQTKVFQQKLEDFQAQRATLETQLQAAQAEGRSADAEALQRQQAELQTQEAEAAARQAAFEALKPKKAEPIVPTAKPLNERTVDELVAAFEASALVPGKPWEIQGKIEKELKLLSPAKKQELADALGVEPRDLAAEFANTKKTPASERVIREPEAADLEDETLKAEEKASLKGSDYAYAKSSAGKQFLIPRPEGAPEKVDSFSKKLLSNLVPESEVSARSQELVQLAKLFNNPEVGYTGITAAPTTYGAASHKAKQIFINSKAFQGLNPAERLGFVFAHEQAHISFEKALSGAYGPEAQARATKAQEWVSTASPEAKKVVEDVIRELHLGKELAGMDGVRDVLANMDPKEWLANNMAMYAAGVMKSSKPKQAFAMLPEPVRKFADWMVSGLQGLVKGAKTWLRLSGGNYKAAKDVKALVDSVRKSFRQAEWDMAQGEKFLDIEPTSIFDRAADLQYAQSRTGDPDFKESPKAFIGNWFNKIVAPLSYLGRTHKELREPVLAIFQADNDQSRAINDVMKVMYGELTSGDKVKLNNPSFERVMGSEPLRKLFDAIQVYSNVKNQRMIKQKDGVTDRLVAELDMEALSPELRGRVAQFTPDAQRALVTVLAQAERANLLTQQKHLEADRNGFTARLASILVNRASFNKAVDFEKGLVIADGVLKDLETGNMDSAAQKLSMLNEVDQAKTLETANLLTKQFLELKAFYDSHPTYMSFRRYKELKQRISKDGQTDVIDASTEGELNALLKEYESKGWTRQGEVMRSKDVKSKEQYQVNDELLALVRNHDAAFSDLVNKLDLPEDLKTQLLSAATTVDVMTREINGRELYRPTGARKFKGDLSRFSWLEQFMHYTPAAIAASQKRALGAKVNYWMQAPGLENMRTQKDQFMALYEQSKQSDSSFWRNLNKANATWHIGWNLPGHIAELFQPMLTGVHELVAQGASLPRAIRTFHQAEKEMLKVQAYRIKSKFSKDGSAKFTHNGEEFEGMPAMWLKANGVKGDNLEIARMLTKASHRYQRAPMSEIQEFVGQDEINLQRLSDGERKLTLGEAVTKPFHTYANAAMGFYSQFPMHNGVVSLVAAYRHARKSGLNVERAQQNAELFDLTTNNSGGKLERPEMFGKLGGAGHMVYSLTSYVRGRFAQLATYYRHGFDGEQFKGKLSPAEITNAKKAFQTMILAQVGAAGLLGLPFVGAGIALMEELLGEDIKGKLINAMNEVTGDPSLGRMFTHGMASVLAESMGVPADLHSRFALSSFLGTNSYDGMSAKSFMGPSVAMLDSLYKLGGALAQGKTAQEALTVGGPGGVKRLAEALGEDFQQKNPDANLAMAALGFRSSQMTKQKEFEGILRKQELEARGKMDESAKRISEAIAISPTEARKALLMEADALVPKELDYASQQRVRAQNVKDLVNKVSMLEAEKVAPVDVRSSITQRTAPLASQTAQAMGVQLNDPMQLARALAQQKTRSTLGQTISQRPVRSALLKDLQWGTNPWDF